MNDYPPVLPGSTQPQGRSFARHAASACLVSPALLVVIGMVTASIQPLHPGPEGRALIMIAGMLSAGVILFGTIFGMLALIFMQRGQRAGVIWRSAVGVSINLSLLLLVAVPNFVRARNVALARRNAAAGVQDAFDDARERSATALARGDSPNVNLDLVQESLGRASKQTSGDDAAIYKGTQAYFKRLQAVQVSFQKSTSEVIDADILETSTLTDRSQIQKRKAIVQDFLEKNTAVKTFVSENEANFRTELQKAGVSGQVLERVVTGFNSTSSPQKPLLIGIRDVDEKMGKALLGALDLLDSTWGHWQSKAGSKLQFEDTAAAGKYNAFIHTIQEASQTEQEMQKQLATIVAKRTP